ncbi:MAG: HNH endonuclease [Thiogranum sp.]|nr:HNH endonuclease [Thiogranum sp.]
MRLRKYSEQQLRSAVQKSTSLRQVLGALGVAEYGGNYTVLRRAIDYFRIDVSHFTGQAWNRGKTLPQRRSTASYLTNGRHVQTNKLKKRLLQEGLFEHQCSNCHRRRWLGRLIPLELDHVNGDRCDNRLINLRLLCPNCHALTPTYRGKNRSKA